MNQPKNILFILSIVIITLIPFSAISQSSPPPPPSAHVESEINQQVVEHQLVVAYLFYLGLVLHTAVKSSTI